MATPNVIAASFVAIGLAIALILMMVMALMTTLLVTIERAVIGQEKPSLANLRDSSVYELDAAIGVDGGDRGLACS